MKKLLSNWKTTSAGLTLIVGSLVPLIFAVKNGTANENNWTTTILAIIGGCGLMFAGDASALPPPTEPPKP